MSGIDFGVDVMARSMTLRLQRHAALAGNVANADTPGYRPTQVAFEDALADAAKKHSSSALADVKVKSQIVDDDVPRPDGNSVSLDKQMSMLSENGILYNATAEFIGRKMRMIKSVM